VYRLGEHAAGQAFEVQIFDRNCSEVFYHPEREFVLQLVPLVLNTLANLLQQPHRFAAAVRAFLATSNLFCTVSVSGSAISTSSIPFLDGH